MTEWFRDLLPMMIMMYVITHLLFLKSVFEKNGNYTIYHFIGHLVVFVVSWLIGCYFLSKTL